MARAYFHARSAGYICWLLAEAALEELHRWRLVRHP